MENNNTDLKRRAALARLAKLSVYTAPTVVSLLAISETSAAIGSCSNMANLKKDKMSGVPGDGNGGDKANTDAKRNLGFRGNSAVDCG